MNLSLPHEVEKFIDEQVSSGRFPSREALVLAAIAELRECAAMEMDDETIAAIEEGEAEGDRGEGIDFDKFRTEFSRRFNRK